MYRSLRRTFRRATSHGRGGQEGCGGTGGLSVLPNDGRTEQLGVRWGLAWRGLTYVLPPDNDKVKQLSIRCGFTLCSTSAARVYLALIGRCVRFFRHWRRSFRALTGYCTRCFAHRARSFRTLTEYCVRSSRHWRRSLCTPLRRARYRFPAALASRPRWRLEWHLGMPERRMNQ